MLKQEFEELRDLLEVFAEFSKEEFDARREEYLEFLELLNQIVALPKKKTKIW